MDENSTKIILAVIALIVAAITGVTWYSKSKKKAKNYKINQSGIKIEGDNNKIVGGDDKSAK